MVLNSVYEIMDDDLFLFPFCLFCLLCYVVRKSCFLPRLALVVPVSWIAEPHPLDPFHSIVPVILYHASIHILAS